MCKDGYNRIKGNQTSKTKGSSHLSLTCDFDWNITEIRSSDSICLEYNFFNSINNELSRSHLTLAKEQLLEVRDSFLKTFKPEIDSGGCFSFHLNTNEFKGITLDHCGLSTSLIIPFTSTTPFSDWSSAVRLLTVKGVEYKLIPQKQHMVMYRISLTLPYDRDEFDVIGFSSSAERDMILDDYILKTWLLDQVKEAVIATDVNGIVMYWNQHATDLYGYTKEETYGNSIHGLLTYEVTEDISMDILSNLKKGNSWKGTFFARHKDGHTISVTDTPIKDSTGAIVGIVGISSDNSSFDNAMQNLEKMRSTLEDEVNKRTLELTKVNKKLQDEVNVRRKVQDQLELLSLVALKTNVSVIMLSPDLTISWMNEASDIIGSPFADLIFLEISEIDCGHCGYLEVEIEKLKE
ncbi:hypothetical protein ROZALSC1DRAFT_29582, partial [Rozella allomycis CSF55]